MPNRDEILREKTYKGDSDSVGQRVYYTITEPKTRPASNADDHMKVYRNTKLLSVLIERLHKDGVLSDDALDDILFEVVM